jgi:DNA repair protein RecO (recombination protein O)
LGSRSTILSDRLALSALNSACALLHFALPERDPHPILYAETASLFDMLAGGNSWLPQYIRWELLLLDELGFGLDLSSCAVTGATTDLAFVSPKSGRAVARTAAGEWADRLLPLPPCLTGEPVTSGQDFAAAFATTGHFLQGLAASLGHHPLPAARGRFIAAVARVFRDT